MPFLFSFPPRLITISPKSLENLKNGMRYFAEMFLTKKPEKTKKMNTDKLRSFFGPPTSWKRALLSGASFVSVLVLTSCRHDSDSVTISLSAPAICSTTAENIGASTSNQGATLTSVKVAGVAMSLQSGQTSFNLDNYLPPSGAWQPGIVMVVATDSTGATGRNGFYVVASGASAVAITDAPGGYPGDTGAFTDFLTCGTPATLSGTIAAWNWTGPPEGNNGWNYGTISVVSGSANCKVSPNKHGIIVFTQPPSACTSPGIAQEIIPGQNHWGSPPSYLTPNVAVWDTAGYPLYSTSSVSQYGGTTYSVGPCP